jgi:nucleolar protein 9
LDGLLELAHNPISSHVLEAALRSKTTGFKYRKKLLQAFMGNYYRLVDDKFGSRVGDTIWEVADGFTKVGLMPMVPGLQTPGTDHAFGNPSHQEKIARSLIPESIKLSNSQYGRFFARKLNLHLLERRPDEWREAQLGLKHHFAHEKEAQQQFARPAATEKPAVPPVKDEAAADDDDAAPVEGKKRKRSKGDKSVEDKETAVIDELFDTVIEKKKKKKKKE